QILETDLNKDPRRAPYKTEDKPDQNFDRPIRHRFLLCQFLSPFVKTQTILALFEDTPAAKLAESVRQGILGVMFDDQSSVIAKQVPVRCSKIVEHDRVIAVVGRIEIDDLPGFFMLASGKGFGFEVDDLRFFLGHTKQVEIFFDQCTSLTGFVDKRDEGGSSGYSLDAYGSGACTKVEKTGF